MTVFNLSWIILDENKSNSDEEKYERNQGIESEYNNYKRIDQCVNSLYSLRTRTELIKNINIGIANPPEWTLQLTEVKDEDAKRGFELYTLDVK